MVGLFDSLGLYTVYTTVPSVGPLPVLELTTETTITVRWNAINCIDQNGPMISYEARLNNGAATIPTSGTRAIFTALSPRTNYTIDVRVQNSQGAGPFGTALIVATNTSDFSGTFMHGSLCSLNVSYLGLLLFHQIVLNFDSSCDAVYFLIRHCMVLF